MTLDELALFASYLALEWSLSETAQREVLVCGATLAMRGGRRRAVLVHMEIRAEILSIAGRQAREDADELWRIIEPTT